MTTTRSYALAGAAVLLFGAHVTGGFQVFGAEPAPAPVPTFVQDTALDGAQILNASCTGCHDLTGVEQATYTEDEWRGTIQRMMGYGAALSDPEFDALVTHLIARRATTLLEAKCTTCHDLTDVEGGRGQNTEEQWRTIMTRMMGYGAVLSDAELEAVMAYLLTSPGE